MNTQLTWNDLYDMDFRDIADLLNTYYPLGYATTEEENEDGEITFAEVQLRWDATRYGEKLLALADYPNYPPQEIGGTGRDDLWREVVWLHAPSNWEAALDEDELSAVLYDFLARTNLTHLLPDEED